MKDAAKNVARSQVVPSPARETPRGESREVDWAEWRDLLVSHRPLRRPWRRDAGRERIFDAETGQVFVLREDPAGLPQPG